VYGYYPSDEVNHDVSLQPALALRSRLARVATIESGLSVGYGRTWVARRRSRIGLVMAGYADGIRRSLSNRGVALVRGRRVPFIGRVAMDMLIVDVTDVPDAEIDDEVTLIGRQSNEDVSADEMAALAGTISYEVLAGIMARVPRLFSQNGRLVARLNLAGHHEDTAP
jgi:alanine racemase